MYTILYIQCTQIFKEYTQFCIFKAHNFFMCGHFLSQINESIRYVHSMSKYLKKCTQFSKFNIHTFKKYTQFSKECTQFCVQYTQFFLCVDIFLLQIQFCIFKYHNLLICGHFSS